MSNNPYQVVDSKTTDDTFLLETNTHTHTFLRSLIDPQQVQHVRRTALENHFISNTLARRAAFNNINNSTS